MANDILVPLQLEEKELTPYPEVEYKVIEANTMDKLIRDVNNHLKNGRQTEWGVVVSSGQMSRFYQAMIRWNVDLDEKPEDGVDDWATLVAKPEMPSENSEAGTTGPKPLSIPGLENEEDLYEDVNEDVDRKDGGRV